MSFTQAEVDFLTSQPLATLATVGARRAARRRAGGFRVHGTGFWIGGSGEAVLGTRKIRNVVGGRTDVALVVDDLVSFDPFVARGIRVYGMAAPPVERVGMVGPGVYVRITPAVSWSWNMEGEPARDECYPSRRAVHGGD